MHNKRLWGLKVKGSGLEVRGQDPQRHRGYSGEDLGDEGWEDDAGAKKFQGSSPKIGQLRGKTRVFHGVSRDFRGDFRLKQWVSNVFLENPSTFLAPAWVSRPTECQDHFCKQLELDHLQENRLSDATSWLCWWPFERLNSDLKRSLKRFGPFRARKLQEREIKDLSGGELQRFAIAGTHSIAFWLHFGLETRSVRRASHQLQGPEYCVYSYYVILHTIFQYIMFTIMSYRNYYMSYEIQRCVCGASALRARRSSLHVRRAELLPGREAAHHSRPDGQEPADGG